MANSPPTHESYLVIGGGTVIGRAIVWQLLQRGETQIAVFDGQDLSHPDSVREWTDPDGGLTRVRIYMGDLSNETDVAGVLAATQATCIFTTAFLKPLGSHDDPRTFARKICVDGTRTILRAIKAGSGISRRLVFLSNAGIFFDGTERTVLSEKDARYQDPATQADSTLSFLTIGEKMALEANDSGADGLRTAAIRPADMYNPSGKLRQAIQEGLTATKPQWVTGPGVQTDKTYFKNVSHAMLLAADRLSPAHPRHASVAGRGFFVSDGKPTPYATIVPAIVAKLQDGRGAPDPEYGKQTMLVFSRINDFVARWRGNNPPHFNHQRMQYLQATRTYDISLARDVLDYAPLISAEEGLQKIAQWYIDDQQAKPKDVSPDVGRDLDLESFTGHGSDIRMRRTTQR
ncbi:unnamed protein product [Mycena citricolor]|uniref:3-beta hydroxysteroid dehydrogenase/isomerase domain-containing protein n=1 Tax=Mycena citricolor TaxID=2018698 RepID=A0AAD2H299_9AGAR|nr:unnamed protein product [Mycena citricolor]